ncbi:hypothetical protein OS493_039568 [Desmophyllum pertusum]|uniref:Uncharacterized protein n=1 Tax=Desmophyllum pertusum TaxID=174260 RepID=A0A9W9Y9Q0_9CNID|nr:hypothetical protein OS493_039568 [Desmophyllum pertusum]
MSKGAKKKAEKLKKRQTLKRPHSRSSEESGNETMSKRTRQSRQPIEINDEKSARDRRKKARARIEDISDEESNDDKMKTSKSKQRGRNQVLKNGRASSRLQRTGRQGSDDEKEERNAEMSNVKSFYGKPTRRTRQQKVSSGEDDDDDDEPAKRRTNASRKPERGYRRRRPQILDDSEDEFDDEEESGKENHRSSLRKIGSRSKSSEKPARRSTRNQRHVPSSPEESAEDSGEDIPQVKNQRAASKKNIKRSKNVSSSSEESDESGHNTSTRQALRNTCHEDNKSNKGTARRKAQGRRGDKIHEDESEDGKSQK